MGTTQDASKHSKCKLVLSANKYDVDKTITCVTNQQDLIDRLSVENLGAVFTKASNAVRL
jgi:hypothetical protein